MRPLLRTQTRPSPLRLGRGAWRPPTKQLASSHSNAETVTDEDIARLAAKPLHLLTLADLIKHGKPPLPSQALYASANFSLSILPGRLAHRIQALRNLPFIVVTNPHITQIHNNYMHSLSILAPLAERRIETPEEEIEFTEVMAGLVQTHADTIPTLARGFLQSRKYISPQAVTAFLDEHLRARIGTRLIAEQHIALHYSSQAHNERCGRHPESSDGSSYIGIIDTALRPASVIQSCESFVAEICELHYGVRPSIVINGDKDTTIAHVPVHLEYVITELLKNAFRATVERGNEREPIEVTIAPNAPGETAPGAVAGNTATTAGPSLDANEIIGPFREASTGVTIRIRDRGGGISPENYRSLWDYGFTTFNDREDEGVSVGDEGLYAISAASAGGSTMAGLGYGLPLGRAYAEYFGGGIAVQSLWHWGTDVYLTLKGVGKV